MVNSQDVNCIYTVYSEDVLNAPDFYKQLLQTWFAPSVISASLESK